MRRLGYVRPIDPVLPVVIQTENASSLDGVSGFIKTFELTPILSAISGRNVSEFGTVRPRLQSRAPDQCLRSSRKPPNCWGTNRRAGSVSRSGRPGHGKNLLARHLHLVRFTAVALNDWH